MNTVVDDEWAVHEWTVMILMMMISWWTITRLMRITFIGESLILSQERRIYQVQLLTRETETEKETANAHPQRIYIDTTQSRLMHHQLVHRTLED